MRRSVEAGLVLAVILGGACGASVTDAGAEDGGVESEDASLMLDGGHDGGFNDAGDAGPEPPDAGPPDAGCVCDELFECCDGCEAINDGIGCVSPEPGTGSPAVCHEGRCVGRSCECNEGPCCDGCFFMASTHPCAIDIVYESRCGSPTPSCPGYSARISDSYGSVFCSGLSSACDGAVMHIRTVSRECGDPGETLYCREVDGEAACDHLCESAL